LREYAQWESDGRDTAHNPAPPGDLEAVAPPPIGGPENLPAAETQQDVATGNAPEAVSFSTHPTAP
ncbi:MAG: hypothetical protein LBF60_02815, partial [Treponema sp.]|nr:hypothetical protein [Treponema sp.]